MSEDDVAGRPAGGLTNERLEQLGTGVQASWVSLAGRRQQLAHPTTRKLEPELEYVGRHRGRTWQGIGGAPTGVAATAKAWRVSDAGRARTAGNRS
jgi:hypothetical protein